MTQIIIISKGKHLDLKTLKMWRIMNPFINQDGMEDHFVWVHRVHQAKGPIRQHFNSSYNLAECFADPDVPFNDEVPPGLREPVAVERRPTAVQFQRYVREFGSFQFHLEIHRLLEELGDRIICRSVKCGVGVI